MHLELLSNYLKTGLVFSVAGPWNSDCVALRAGGKKNLTTPRTIYNTLEYTSTYLRHLLAAAGLRPEVHARLRLGAEEGEADLRRTSPSRAAGSPADSRCKHETL